MDVQIYDVIVVGAGPSGSTAATVLAKAGLKTLLLDREDFPRVKACGDAVQSQGFHIMRQIGFTDPWPAHFFDIKHLSLVGPSGGRTTIGLNGKYGEQARIVTRYDFDDLLLQHAIKSGAEFKKALVTEPVIDNNYVVGVKAKIGKVSETYRSRLVIAADGATSVIARGLNVPAHPDQHKALSLRGYVEIKGDLDRTIELAFIRGVLPGYGWIFPMGNNCANIGIGIRADAYKKNKLPLEKYLEFYVNAPHIRDIIGNNPVHEIKSWQLPLCSIEQQRVFNGAILVGDAGGFVNPLTGAGIAQGMTTAKIAAELAIKAMQTGDFSKEGLAAFEPLWREDLYKSMRNGAIAQSLLSVAPRTFDFINWFGKINPGIVQKVFAKV